MIAQKAHVKIHHQVDALGWIGTVADDVAEAIDFGNALLADIRQHGLKRFQISVYVTDQRSQGSHPGCSERPVKPRERQLQTKAAAACKAV